ncbi:WEB family protein At3g51220-like [Macadamia integrifolia]|uniref:WEB family protein At3g51220-like n=1 Tax=Macadamia integrifolia TaxID=60698 RepID=UPI001C4F3BED|nr:WEB family protein At3g51220-like [Macadamia integrifolia]
MEPLSPPIEKTITTDHFFTIDTSRPFRSVKEAVALFGERSLTGGDIYIQKTYTSPKQARDVEHSVVNTLKKIEAELKETKRELKLLKEKESETEIALASLNAELHKNMSKMAKAEAEAAAKAVTTKALVVRKDREDDTIKEEEEKGEKDPTVRTHSSVSLSKILSLGEKEDYYYELTKKQKKMMKKKPIVPLLGDIFISRKKGSSTTLHNPLYSTSTLKYERGKFSS